MFLETPGREAFRGAFAAAVVTSLRQATLTAPADEGRKRCGDAPGLVASIAQVPGFKTLHLVREIVDSPRTA